MDTGIMHMLLHECCHILIFTQIPFNKHSQCRDHMDGMMLMLMMKMLKADDFDQESDDEDQPTSVSTSP